MRARPLLSLLALHLLLVACPPPAPIEKPPRPAADPGEIRFCLREGAGHNCLLRDRTVAAHVLATSGPKQRLVVAFPSENSGVAFWADPAALGEVRLSVEEPLESQQIGELRGLRFVLRSSAGLRIEKVLLGSIRLIRDYQHARKLELEARVLDEYPRRFAELPPALKEKLARLGAQPEALRERAKMRVALAARDTLEATSQSLDGRHRFLLRLRVRGGSVQGSAEAPLLLAGEASRPLELEVTAASSCPPYRGLGVDELLRPSAREHLRRLQARPELKSRHEPLASALRSLAFLSTDRKFLAGSWRFLTYFGRDTLMSLWLLQPALAPAAIESGLQSVLDRLSPTGEVAHEESLGDQAVLERLDRWNQLIAGRRLEELEAELRPLGDPVFDYKMVDDDFMMAPLLAEYLDDEAVSSDRARAFLSGRTAGGRSNLEALAANLAFLLGRAAPYAASGQPVDLVPLKDGLKVGDWRDSEEGLGFGRFASSVNAYLVPAALRATGRILRSSKLDAAALGNAIRRASGGRLASDLAALADKLAQRWDGARQHFEVRLAGTEARERLAAFLRGGAPADERGLLAAQPIAAGVTASAVAGGVASSLLEKGLRFDALSLNQDGSPVEVMNTDEGFALLAGGFPAEELGHRLRKYELAYPLGLDDRFGIYVASPALSGRPADWTTFDRGHYHGTVVWSWQLILLQRGLMRQLDHFKRVSGREGPALADRIRAVLERIAAAEQRVGGMRASELWTVQVKNGRFEPVAFGQTPGHADESNALQLWSDLNLAIDLERTRLGLLPAP